MASHGRVTGRARAHLAGPEEPTSRLLQEVMRALGSGMEGRQAGEMERCRRPSPAICPRSLGHVPPRLQLGWSMGGRAGPGQDREHLSPTSRSCLSFPVCTWGTSDSGSGTALPCG